MKNSTLRNILLLSVLILSLLGCGGGGGTSPSSGTATDTVVSGTASKGLIANGRVDIFAINTDGSKSLIETTTTDDQGRYEASLGEYQGPVLVEVSGNYLDEASGLIVTVTEETPLRAVLAAATGTISLAVTPLTELAVQKAEDGIMTVDKISAANLLVSNLFGFDIVATQPVAPDAATLSTSTATEKDYTLALAAISQMSYNASTAVSDILADLGAELITGGGLSWDSIDDFDTALEVFLDSVENQTGVTTPVDTGLIDVSRTEIKVRLSVAGLSDGDVLEGLQGVLILPEGAKVDNVDEAISTVGVATGSLIEVQYWPETATEFGEIDFALIHPSGFSAGEVVTIEITILGKTLSEADSFTLSDIVAVDGAGATVSGVTVSLVAEAI